VFALFAALPALAQQDLSLCKGGFSNDDLRVRVESAANAVVTGETEVARRLVKRTQDQLPCLEVLVARAPLAELAWLQAWLSYLDQDESRAARWARLGMVASGDALPAFVPPEHPFREFAATEPGTPTRVGDGRVVPPRGGGLFLDGEFLPLASGWVDTPGLLQVADEFGRVVSTSWVEGNTFPDELVGEPGPEARSPRWWTGTPADAVELASARGSSRVSVGRLLASGGLALAAGGLYGVAAASTAGLENATTEQELAGARSRVNVLAFGSGVLAASALGVGATVWLHDGAGFGLSFRF
jgi:hypothetical protein